MLGSSKKCVQNLPTILKGRWPQGQYPPIPGQYSSTDDEEIRDTISPFHGCVWSRAEWKTSCMGSAEVQGASSVAGEYIGWVGEGGYLNRSLDIFLAQKRWKTHRLWHAMGTCWQYLMFRGKFLKIEPCDKDGTSHAWVNWYYGHFKQTRMVDFTHAPAISHNLNYISRFIQSRMSQAVTTRDFVQYGRHLP